MVHLMADEDNAEAVSLVLPRGLRVSVPYFWERRSTEVTYPQMYIDFSREHCTLITSTLGAGSCGVDLGAGCNVLTTFNNKRPASDVIVKRVRAKFDKSTLISGQ